MEEEEFQKEYEQNYHFFLSELKGIQVADLAIIIELMRCAQHIKDIQKLMLVMTPEENELSEEDEMSYWSKHDSLVIMILNISAAQLRESLKLFWKLSKTALFQNVLKEISEKDKSTFNSLIELNNEYEEKKGFIWEVLKPLRDSVFHYSPDEVTPWIEKIKGMESEKKPPYQSINIEEHDYGPGRGYDSEIYSKYLFLGNNWPTSIMKAQKQVWNTQMNFLRTTGIFIETILKKEKIPKRKYGWFMEFFHGYKSN